MKIEIMNYHHLFQNYSRREVLMRSGLGIGWMAASTALQQSINAKPPALNQHEANTLAPRSPHFPARAKAVIHIFANGGGQVILIRLIQSQNLKNMLVVKYQEH